MYRVSIANNSGKTMTWDYFYYEEQAQHERDLLIDEHDFYPDDVFINEI